MREIRTDDKVFSQVTRGVAWAAADLPKGRVENGRVISARGPVRLLLDKTLAGGTGYELSDNAGALSVAAGQPLGFLSGLLNLAAKLRAGEPVAERIVPRFTSRFYKHESNLYGPSKGRGHAWVGELDEEFWVGYMKALVRMHFTGLVFYPGYHPFECFLDYDRFPEAPSIPARTRAATLAGLKRAFGVARSFGLVTFMQHYLTHFPEGLAKANNLILRGTAGGSRLSALDHPVVDEYSRYVYRRTFEILPELTGFYCNFESAANSGAFVKRCLFPEAVRAKSVPQFVFRLWDFNSPKAMADLLRSYDGKIRLGHKIQDRADYYYFPKADPRVIEWKGFFPDTEFMFISGPCHNSATIQSRKLWCDADFVHALLADAREKGADSLAFHTVYELLTPDIDAKKIAGEYERHMAILNRGHLDATVDYFRGEHPGEAVLARRFARRARIDISRANAAVRSIKETSNITLTMYQQFLHTSSEEGYLYTALRSYYQDPFLHLPTRFVNDEPTNAMTLTTAWLNRNYRLRNVSDATLPVIDFANPAKAKAALTPPAIARKLTAHMERAKALAAKAAGPRPPGVMKTFLNETTRMRNWGTRDRQELLTAASLYRIYFAKSRAAAVKAIADAIQALKGMRGATRPDDPLAVRKHVFWQETRFEDDLKRLALLARKLSSRDFPFEAFAAYARSLERYNEIRRHVRPNKIVRPKEMRIIRRQLRGSIAAAREAVGFLSDRRHARLRANVVAWLAYVECELADTTPPTMDVLPAAQAGPDEGFVGFVHDQCFRFGEDCIEDLLGFFRPRDWKRSKDTAFRMTHGKEGLTVTLVERGINPSERRKLWKRFRYTRSETFFWRLWIDRENTGSHMDVWSIMTGGWALFKGGYTIIDRQNAILKTGQPVEGGKGRMTQGRDWWRIDYLLPWRLLGGPVKSGDTWRFNVTTVTTGGSAILPNEPTSERNNQYAWCQGYEMTAANDFTGGKPERMGTVTFR